MDRSYHSNCVLLDGSSRYCNRALNRRRIYATGPGNSNLESIYMICSISPSIATSLIAVSENPPRHVLHTTECFTALHTPHRRTCGPHYSVLHCITHPSQTDMWPTNIHVTNHREKGRHYILPSAQ
jgi:hypothetical protein